MRSVRLVVGLILLFMAISQFALVVVVKGAANTVPVSKADEDTALIDANALKPPECVGINITGGLVYGDGDLNGGTGKQLILGGSTDQTIHGNAHDDCIVGGGGTDTLDGDGGTDVCIGSATSTFVQCETEYVQ